MKKVLFLIFCLGIFITNVSALTMLPATVTSNDNEKKENIELIDGVITLPTFCMEGTGCTITVDDNTLKTIGKYNFGSGTEYFYIKSGKGATIYEAGGPNPATQEVYETSFNKIVITPTDFISSGSIIIGIGSGDEARDIKFVSTIENTDTKLETPIDNDSTNETNSILKNDTVKKDDNVFIRIGSLIGIVLLALIIGIACTKNNKD